MLDFIKSYCNKWKKEFVSFTPQDWGATFAFGAAVAVPLAISAGKEIYKVAKKEIDKYKKKKGK